MVPSRPPLTLLDVISAVCEASTSIEEAERVVRHLLSSGQMRLPASLLPALRDAAHDRL